MRREEDFPTTTICKRKRANTNTTNNTPLRSVGTCSDLPLRSPRQTWPLFPPRMMMVSSSSDYVARERSKKWGKGGKFQRYFSLLLGVDARAHTHTHTFISENFTSFTTHSRRARRGERDLRAVVITVTTITAKKTKWKHIVAMMRKNWKRSRRWCIWWKKSTNNAREKRTSTSKISRRSGNGEAKNET